MRLPVSRMFQRTIFACRSLKTDADLLLVEARLGAFREERGHHLRLHRVDGGVALLLDGDLVGGAEVGLGDAEHRLLDLRDVGRLEVARLLGGALGELDDRVDHRLEARGGRT